MVDRDNAGTVISTVFPWGAATKLLRGAEKLNAVFWAGGRAAEDAARAFANANNGVIMTDTAAGRALAQATEGMSWTEARLQTLKASQDFARAASGEVNVFQNARGLSLDSLWRSEYSILMQNPNVTRINYHIVMPNGTAVRLP
jgi:acyl-CoA synthetase (NDP forming)